MIFLYISYVMPTLIGCHAFGRTWTVVGPFNLGVRWYRVLGVASVLGACTVVWIGVQPPNDKALTVLIVATLTLLAAWWLGIRSRFRGPPQLSITQAAPRP